MIWKSSVLAAAVLVMAAAQGAAQEKPVLKIANWVAPNGMAVRGVMGPLADRIERDAAGLVEVQRFWGGSLGRNPNKQFDLIKDGVIDIGWHVAGYTPGQFPQVGVFELPFLGLNAAEGSLALQRGFDRGLYSGFDDVKVVGMHTGGTYGVHSRAKVTRIDDLNGLKVTTSGPIQAAIVKFFGGVAIAMPASGVPEAISRGAVEGSLQGWTSLATFKLDQVTEFHLDAPLGQPSFLALMNKRKWESLPEKVKAAITKNGGETFAGYAGTAFFNSEGQAHDTIGKRPGHTLTELTGAEFAALRARVKPIHDEWIGRTPNGQKVYDAINGILAGLRDKK